MKKLACFGVAILLFMILFVGCNTSSGTSDTTPENIRPTTPPVQPYDFDSMEEAISFLTSDLSEYSEEIQRDYRPMIERFREDKFLLRVYHEEFDLQKSHLALYPRTELEDVGIQHYVTYKGQEYQVLVFSVDKEVIATLNEPYSISKYLKHRKVGVKEGEKSELNGEEIYLTTVGITESTKKICVNKFIDETHYYTIRTKASWDELLAFASEVKFEKIPLPEAEPLS